MNELTLELDCCTHKELPDYLLTLPGVLNVNIDNSTNLIINIKYNYELITTKILKLEILLFLNSLKIPSIISFNKHTKNKVLKYNMQIKNLCCEYCFKGIIDDLFMTQGIEKVDSNFNENIYLENEDITININYNPELINEEKLKKMELEFNI